MHFSANLDVFYLRNMSAMSQKLNSDSNVSNLILAFVVVVSMLGLLGFAFIDESTRPVFIEVAKVSVAAYLGYLIPNGK